MASVEKPSSETKNFSQHRDHALLARACSVEHTNRKERETTWASELTLETAAFECPVATSRNAQPAAAET
eukprot:3165151-Pleurochrysis_carterae.AAC.1